MDNIGKDNYGRNIAREKIGESFKYHIYQDDKEVLTLAFSEKVPFNKVLSSINSMQTGVAALDDRRDAAKANINNVRAVMLNEPIEFDGVLYDNDAESIAEISGVLVLIKAGVKLPKDFVWRSYDNKNIPMTAEKLLELATAIFAYRYEVKKKSWDAKDAIGTSDKPESISI
jgi:hypothetical protein